MGDDIDCCRRPTNFGKKDLKTYRGIKPKNNPNFHSSNSKDFDNFGSFKKPDKSDKNSNKKGNSYLNSIYGNENEAKFPNFSEFDIEPVSEPLYQEKISQPQQLIENGNVQYIDSNTNIPNTNYNNVDIPNTNYNNADIQNTNYNNEAIPNTNYNNADIQNTNYNNVAIPNTNYNNVSIQQSNYNNPAIQKSNYNNPTIQNTNYNNASIQQSNYNNETIQNSNYNNATKRYSPPQIQKDNAQYIQPEFNISNYEQNKQTNYINNNPQEYTSNINVDSQPVEYLNSTNGENILNQYDNTHKILPTKYIEIQRPAIYANNNIPYQSENEYSQLPLTNYVESSSTNQQYENYNFSDTTTQYYESNNNMNYIPPKTEEIYNNSNQYIEGISNPQSQEIHYSNYLSQTSYVQSPQQIYIEKKPLQTVMEPKAQIESQMYVQQPNNFNENEVYRAELRSKQKFPSDGAHKKPKKLKKKRKIIEYYSEDDEEEEESDDEEDEDEQSSSQNEEIEERNVRYKKINKKSKNKNKHKIVKIIKKKKKSKNPKKQQIKYIEDKENESDNIDYGKNITNDNNKNKIIEKNQNFKKGLPKEDEEEFLEFQKEPEMSKEFYENTEDNFDDIYSNKNNDNLKFSIKEEGRKVINLKNGGQIIGNFKKEEILENKNENAEKEREDLFQGKTLKAASVEKKEETTGCQVPGFISNIFSKIF